MVVPQVRPRCTHREEAAAAAEEGGAPREVSETGPRPGRALLPALATHGPLAPSCPPGPRHALGRGAGNLSFVGGGAGGCWGPSGRAAVAIRPGPRPRPRAQPGGGGVD